MNDQINIIKRYFNVWLTQNKSGLTAIFTPDIHYVECYGAEYSGIDEVDQWIDHKFKVQTVTKWDIKNIYHDGNIFTIEWVFACIDHNKSFNFDGVSLITFKNEYISEIKEFESKHEHYRPYK